MNRIGGEFAFEKNPNTIGLTVLNRLQERPFRLFDSGRSAIRACLKMLNRSQISLPRYTCESVVRVCEDCGYTIRFFSIANDFSFVMEDLVSSLADRGVLLFHPYFGFPVDSAVLQQIKEACTLYDVTIVEDTTHSFFSSVQTIGTYCIASFRKWFPLPDGGIAYSAQELDLPLSFPRCDDFSSIRFEAMRIKSGFLQGENDKEELFLEKFEDAEKILDTREESYSLSSSSRGLLDTFDIDGMIEKRRSNYFYLYSHLGIFSSWLTILTPFLAEGVCPMFLVISCSCRNKLRSFLRKQLIFCPVHWPEVRGYATVFSEHSMSLPIDQRYGETDMHRLFCAIKEFADARKTQYYS